VTLPVIIPPLEEQREALIKFLRQGFHFHSGTPVACRDETSSPHVHGRSQPHMEVEMIG
jgi:hypothetical protein